MRMVFVLLLFPALIFAQYWGERVTEKSFESSALYFNSYYLNPFSIYNFKEVSLGLIDDPFLALHLNPASLPADSAQIYLDFRGDRHEPAVVNRIMPTPYMGYDSYAPGYIVDPRWYSVTRSEPEPIVSFGFLSRPYQRLSFNATYQFIYKEEPFYQSPAVIYNSRYGMDDRGNGISDNGEVPVVNRSAGEDYMLTSAHLAALNTAFLITPRLSIGVTASTVYHQREGQYARLRTDEYSSNDLDDWRNQYSKERRQQYHHIDLAAGLRYRFSEKLSAGIKAGYLKGKVTQDYTIADSSVYRYTQSTNNYNSNYQSYRNGLTDQNWQHDGDNVYGRLTVDYTASKNRRIRFFYAYADKHLTISNRSTIRDTSHYSGSWNDGDSQSAYNSWYSFNDQRHGNGSGRESSWQTMLSFLWQETPHSRVNFGIHFAEQSFHNSTDEPVAFSSASYHHWQYITDDQPPEIHEWNYSRYEDKRLIWEMHTLHQKLQIPLMLEYDINSNWTLLIVVNRIWQRWKVEDQTTAYFTTRYKNDNGQIEEEHNFGERYSQPARHISEDTTDLISGLTVHVSPAFTINLLVNPSFNSDGLLAQWWLGFRAKL